MVNLLAGIVYILITFAGLRFVMHSSPFTVPYFGINREQERWETIRDVIIICEWVMYDLVIWNVAIMGGR